MRVWLSKLGYEIALPPALLAGRRRVALANYAVQRTLEYGVDTLELADMRQLLVHLGSIGVEQLSAGDVITSVANHIRWGSIWVLEVERGSAGIADESEPEEHDPEPQREHALWIELVYPNDQPASDIAYRRTKPNQDVITGTTGSDGVIEEDPAPGGTHAIALQEVEGVSWSAKRIRVKQKATLEATTSGFGDGTPVEFKIFRQYKERDTDLIDRATGEVYKDRARIRWAYDPASYSADHAAEQGIVTFIAQASIGDSWSKTLEPVEVELATLVDARWTEDSVVVGQPCQFYVKTLGIVDGTAVKIKLFEVGHEVDDAELDELVLEVTAGETRGTWSFPIENEDDAPYVSAECFFEAKIGDRSAVSDVIWIQGTP